MSGGECKCVCGRACVMVVVMVVRREEASKQGHELECGQRMPAGGKVEDGCSLVLRRTKKRSAPSAAPKSMEFRPTPLMVFVALKSLQRGKWLLYRPSCLYR